MEKKEFEKKLKELGLEKVEKKGLIKAFLQRNIEHYLDSNKSVIYTCQKLKNGEYELFFKDMERGITEEIVKNKDEGYVYEKLYLALSK